MPAEVVGTLIVGGGQAGLAMSHALGRRGWPHVVLERARIGERWRSERWEGLRFQFPNWSVRLPGFPFRHADPEGFATSPEIVDFLLAYADFIEAPVRTGVAVEALKRHGSGFLALTSHGPLVAETVVVATGPYQEPIVPPLLAADADIFQVHASRYRNPQLLPGGAVLVVGSGASGAQIAEELQRAGRRVFLSVGRHRRMPRRYRGRDLIWWLSELGIDQTPVETRGPDRTLPLITGAYGGHTIDFRRFAAQGMTLLGRLAGCRDGVLDLAPDLAASIAAGDAAYDAFLDRVDAHVAEHGLALPEDADARERPADPPGLAVPPRRLDLRAENVGAIIWATGYTCDFRWIDLPVLDPAGEPVHRAGMTAVPGLYFLGLQWLSRMSSSFLAGVGHDAERLAQHIVGRTVPAR